ncbi:MAG: GPR endopeptidase [Eubacterium sp.]|nr:GPR endopeptidase [Eubacterium sp.]MDY5497673.1 GPR endopeptidase [Anaerobutyricum sp.]
MTEKNNIPYAHTDLALELKEELCGQDKIPGIRVEERTFEEGNLRETVIYVENEEGAGIIGKPPGVYITIEGENMGENDGGFHEKMSECLAQNLGKLLKGKRKILFAGLGNGRVTPDALGPLVIKNLFVTRHLWHMKEIDSYPEVSAIAPGVMAQTGMETGEILLGIIQKIHPDALVVIDALAAKSSERLNRTVQIGNTGIIPGSGVRNHRHEISEKTMGIPVLAIGVPTVISIPSLACDIMDSFCSSLKEEEKEDSFRFWNQTERYRFLSEILDRKLWDLFVTPKEIDESVKRISFTLSEGINHYISKCAGGNKIKGKA